MSDIVSLARKKTFVFVGGLHRSGTTLLRDLIAEHPAVSSFRKTGVPMDEGQHLQDVFLPAKAFGGPGRFALNPDAYMNEFHPLVAGDSFERIFQQWSMYWDLDKRFLLEKSPPNIIRTRFLQALFPGAKFVMILRNPIHIALATQKWNKSPIQALVNHVLTAYEILLRDVPHLENVLLVRYESLVESPAEELLKIFDFIGLNRMGDMDYLAIDSSVDDRYRKIWMNEGSVFLDELNSMDKVEERMRRFGYSLYFA